MIIVKKGSWSWSGGLIVMGLKAILRNSWNWFNLVRKCFSREKYPLYSLVPINQGQPHGDSWLNRAFRYFRRKHTHVEQTYPLPWPSPSQWHRQVVGWLHLSARYFLPWAWAWAALLLAWPSSAGVMAGHTPSPTSTTSHFTFLPYNFAIKNSGTWVHQRDKFISVA